MIKLDLIDKHSYNQISNNDLQQAHLGLVIIGVKGLHRENVGAKPQFVFMTIDLQIQNKDFQEVQNQT